MKKALVLGVLAIFAINIATVQTVNAQNKTDKKKTEKKEKKVVKPAAASWDTEKDGAKGEGRSSVNQAKGTETKKVSPKKANTKKVEKDDPTSKNVMPARTNDKQAKGTETKSKKAIQTLEKKDATPKTVGKESDPTAKNKTPEIGVPPTPNKTKAPKQANANGNNSGDSK